MEKELVCSDAGTELDLGAIGAMYVRIAGCDIMSRGQRREDMSYARDNVRRGDCWDEEEGIAGC
ncbi:hypothetical protein BOTCAL_0061g00400 [Botryotinia calthae]|uniref:Uncharacterized protein n=1 Tax=Botryotinia calthae TaxID=38488 RepID=A0A4Y8DAC8_9HELO|nr:hypothetical protein BOTCAL_0061g00400 [Botryotinia calthae]